MSYRFSAGFRGPLVLAAGVLCGTLALPATANAAATCSFSAATAVVTVTVPDNDDAIVGRNVAGNIQVNGANCGAATVTNTDTIGVNGPGTTAAPGDTDITLSFANGPLAPGKTAETGGGAVSEIEGNLQLGNGYDTLVVTGGAGIDKYNLGTLGFNSNGDADNDWTLSGVDGTIELGGGANNDIISGAGDLGTGSPRTRGLYVLGGAGNDSLTGGSGNDYLWGDAVVQFGAPAAAGNDELFGGNGGDVLYGQTGNDLLEGQSGSDGLKLGLGTDTLRGGDQNDYINDETSSSAPDGPDDISGGRGSDSLDMSNRSANLAIRQDNVANDGQDIVAPIGVAEEGDNIRHDLETFYLGQGPDRFDGDEPATNAAELRHYVEGNNGNDLILLGDGNDSAYGESGNDSVQGQGDDDTVRGDEDNDTVLGGDGNDNVYGGLGSDITMGEAGDDYLQQESSADGADLVSGGTGIDDVYYGSRTTNTLIVLDNTAQPAPKKGNDGADVDQNGIAEEGDDIRADNERIWTGSGNDRINASTPAANPLGANNTFYGGANNDILNGGTGDDYLDGDAGNDQLTGGPGSDELYGDAGADRFFALDTYWYDYLDGGFDSDPDSASGATGNADPFDDQVRIP